MKVEKFSHYRGEEIVDQRISTQILATLTQLPFRFTHGCANQLRKAVLSELKTFGWSDEFILDPTSQISLTSFLQDHVLCLQTGNMSRFYADLLKMQYVFEIKKAKAAFYILPSKEAAQEMGSNIAHFDRFTKELELFQKTITIPTLVLGIN